MAGDTSGAWKMPLVKDSHVSDSSFPGLKSPGSEKAAKLDNTEVQQDELLALEAIYGEDFINHDGGQSAWKVGFIFPPVLKNRENFLIHDSDNDLCFRKRNRHSIFA